MKVAIFGATGSLGSECLAQAIEAGHQVTVLVRTPSKLPSRLRDRLTIVAGDALDPSDVVKALGGGVEAVLFAIGVDRRSPENLCRDATQHILAAMPRLGVRRFVWCGGGSTIVDEDAVTLGARVVEWVAATFMPLRHRDKVRQLELLTQVRDVDWVGIRPLQMRSGPKRGVYRLGFHPYSGLSKIRFADCAHAMLGMLTDDTWRHKAPVVQY
jgi:putative NADH-flavin reductase